MHGLKAGHKWLFYLRKGNPIVLDYYANDSVPFSDAQEEIARRSVAVTAACSDSSC